MRHGNNKEIAGKSLYAYKVKSDDLSMKPVKYKPMKKLNKNTQFQAKFTYKDCFAFNDSGDSDWYSDSDSNDDDFFDEENGELRPTVNLIGGLMLPDALVDC